MRFGVLMIKAENTTPNDIHKTIQRERVEPKVDRCVAGKSFIPPNKNSIQKIIFLYNTLLQLKHNPDSSPRKTFILLKRSREAL